MKVVDGKAQFPIKNIVVNSLIEGDELAQLLYYEGFVSDKKEIYDESELAKAKDFLANKNLEYTVSDAPTIANDADTFNFNNKDELVKYVNEGKSPKKTVEQLEAEVKSLEDVLLTMMFSGVQ